MKGFVGHPVWTKNLNLSGEENLREHRPSVGIQSG